MYVLCAGMYRACSTWQYEVIAHLLERHRGGDRLGYLTGEEFAERDRATRDHAGWTILKSHEGHRQFSKVVAEKRAIVVYAHRDVRDVVFSLMHKRGVSFRRLFRQGMIHQILVNDRFWSRQPNVLTQRYEQVVANPVEGVLQLANHIGIEISEPEAAEVASEYSFQTNRKRTQELVARLRDQGVDLEDPSNLQYYDHRTLLHWNHMREGRPGNWRELASPRERAILSRLCDSWLINHEYEADTRGPRAEPRGLSTRLRDELELAGAWATCALRCAALRYPKSASLLKRVLRISNAKPPAVPAKAPTPNTVRVDAAQVGGTPAGARSSADVLQSSDQ
ncbi:sulfotransferase domain-containing protein [Singulisphaera rosea]